MTSWSTLKSSDLITFDIFGTVLDWRTGLERACVKAGRPLRAGEFDRIVGLQGDLERGEFLSYTEITARSLGQVLALPPQAADSIARGIGDWPVYPDAPAALRKLMERVPCAAMTNSDLVHRDPIQRQLGFALTDWLCAEEIRVYKPHPRFWHLMAQRRGTKPGKHWWHVSAYADYDLATANDLGLTTIFVERPHARPGPATCSISHLDELLRLVC